MLKNARCKTRFKSPGASYFKTADPQNRVPSQAVVGLAQAVPGEALLGRAALASFSFVTFTPKSYVGGHWALKPDTSHLHRSALGP